MNQLRIYNQQQAIRKCIYLKYTIYNGNKNMVLGINLVGGAEFLGKIMEFIERYY